jgi:hypothetical protein
MVAVGRKHAAHVVCICRQTEKINVQRIRGQCSGGNSLSQVDKLARLNLYAVVVVHDVISGFQAAVVEVLLCG